MKRVCVIGSLNVDLTISIPYFHAPGESIIGSGFGMFAGGKGGNQAVALGRLGADAVMAGMVGNDENGRFYRNTLKRERVDDRFVSGCDTTTGVALIEVNTATGDNRIAVHMGANEKLTPTYIDSIWDELSACDIFLMQFEMPMETVIHAAKKINALGKTLILDPAPARQIPDELLPCATYITPNETELQIITGRQTENPDLIREAATLLISRGARHIVAKMGAAGAMLVTSEGAQLIPGFAVKAVDTTAAGDSFNAGLAYALSEGKPLNDAIVFANAVGAIATTSMGAQAAMPTLETVLEFMKNNQNL